ncbi:MAG: radical SAM protein [Nitrospirae bacterium]|nr:radical SAM protein [Nitrospirota bacterium]
MSHSLISKPIPSSKYYFERYLSPRKRHAAENLRPRIVDFELTSKCAGACTYCYTSSPFFKGQDMPTELALRLVDELVELGISQVQWCGGDPILHADWEKVVTYAGEKGLNNSVFVAGIVSKRVATILASLPNLHLVGINFDTIDPEEFAKTHTQGRVLKIKYQALENLKEAGFHPSRIMPCLTLTKPIARSIERTLDYLVDEWGAGYVPMFVYHPIGQGTDDAFTPNRDEIRRAYEYRAKKMGDHWLRIGPTECGKFYCRSKFHITYDGRVLPCAVLYDFEVGNVNREPLKEIVSKNATKLCYDFDIHGPCAKCADSDVCWGCRANAYFYSGDITGSDPMCWKHGGVPIRRRVSGGIPCGVSAG